MLPASLDTESLLYIDLSVLLLLAGDSAEKKSVLATLKSHLAANGELATSTVALEGVFSHFLSHSQPTALRSYLRMLQTLMSELLSPGFDDFHRALEVRELYQLSDDRALEIAMLLNHGIGQMVSLECCQKDIPNLRLLEP